MQSGAPQLCQVCEPRRDLLVTHPLQPTEWHPRFCSRHDIRQPQDAETRRYLSKDVADGVRGLFIGGIRDGDKVSLLDLADVQRKALKSWEGVTFPLGKRTTTHFALEPVFDIFDDYFFCGSLHGRIDIVWTDILPTAEQKGYTSDAAGSLHRATIFIKRPHAEFRTWTKRLVNEVLQTLLHEMIHAVFNVYECRCCTCMMRENHARNTGVSGSGHGPVWRDLGQAVQQEANKMFLRDGEGWDLDVERWGGSHVRELRAILELRMEGRIGKIDGLVDAMLA